MSVADDYLTALFRTDEPTRTDTPVEVNGGAGDTAYGLKALTSEAHLVASSPNGQRNDALNRAWYRMGRVIQGGNLTVETARNALADAARAAGLGADEIDKTLRTDSTSGLAQGARAPRTPATELEPIPVPTVLEGATLEHPEAGTLEAFWTSRDLLTHLHDFARARRVAPWAVLGSALARVIVTTHPAVALPPIVGGYASLNYFVAIVGRSGSGKGAADAVAREALDFGVPIVTRNTGSGEGAVHAYVKRTKDGLEQHTDAVLFSIPEIDSLGAVGARQGATIISLLRQAWSGEQLGFQYADPTKNLVVQAHRYRMALIAGVQPGRAGTLLDDSDGGLPQRFTWLDAVDRHAPASSPLTPTPRSLKPGRPVELTGASGLCPMDVCLSARELVDATRLANLRGQLDALDGHAVLARLKTAAALALLERRHDVTEEDWELSGIIARVSDATRAGVLEHRRAELAKAAEGRAMAEATRQIIVKETMADRDVARVCRALLRQLDKHEMAWAEARRTLRSGDRGFFDEAVDSLVKSGQIAVTEVENGQRIARIEPT